MGSPRPRFRNRDRFVSCCRAVVVACAIAVQLAPAHAQYSPNCQRNGSRDFCAFTPGSTSASPTPVQDVGWLVFADHSVYALQREEGSCRDTGVIRTCRAWIITPPGSDRAKEARYVGTAYEGGYRHDYLAPGLSLSFSFLD